MKVILEVLKSIIQNPSPSSYDGNTVSGKVKELGILKVTRNYEQNEVSGLPTVNILVTLNDTKVYSYHNYDFSLDELLSFNSRFQSAKRSQDAALNEKQRIDMANFSDWYESKLG
ncbi:MAG: hypothetical protein M5Z89_10110 [Olivibacter sp.]|nr:hypothetical protein [Olivibacter sp. UJ_SKK_5.1]